jgi:pimeloyl-ACP methyl ester carboxylesterase
MANFILVHGSGQNAGCWSRVSSELRTRGHAVATPELPKRAPGWTLEDHAAKIAESAVAPRSVVVGHSFSGAFLPLVAQMCDCSLLVFLAAVIPEPGKSVRDQFTEDPAMFSSEWIAAGPRWFDKSQEKSLAKEFLFHDCDEETTSWALRTVASFDTRNLVTQPAPFAQWPNVPVASIVATSDRTLSPAWIRRISRHVLRTEAIEVQAGHCPHVSRPGDIADVLEQLATHGRIGDRP